VKASLSKITAALLVAVILALTLASCGTTVYKKQGITFELPSSFEQRAIENALYAYGDDESFIVFTKRTKSELAMNGLSELDVPGFTEYFLETSEMKDSVEVNYGVGSAEFRYIVGDPENEEVYSYYYTVIMRGTDCIWIAQMACYEPLASEYIPEFSKWAASITVE
jgi:hypothetical protein